MKTSSITTLTKIMLLSLALFCIIISSRSVASDNNAYQEQINAIDDMHQKFCTLFFTELLKNSKWQSLTFSTISALEKAVDSENAKKDHITSLALIINNMPLLRRNYDHPTTYKFIEQLLDHNALSSATTLLKVIHREAGAGLNSQVKYLFAYYHFQREDWLSTLKYIDTNISLLALEKHHHALLMKGIALQKLTKHRQAQKAYEKITPDSLYYIPARFNLALANIKRGWWTEGHLIIRDLLEKQTINEKTLNRLYLSLGYSLLKQGYYRNARATFQLVGIHSQDVNQAILGIALTAAQQDDYIGALNASRFLKEKKEDDLPTDESYLLMPYFYEKSQQLVAASFGYSEAISYYQNKIYSLEKIIKSSAQRPLTHIEHSAAMTINDSAIDFSSTYPNIFFINQEKTLEYKQWLAQLNNPDLEQKFKIMRKAYNDLAVKMAGSILQNKLDNLNSYLNQSRYGLARLFDNNTVEQ